MVTERRSSEDKPIDVSTLEELREAVAARDELLSLLGHELRNAMAPLILLVPHFETMPTDDINRAKVNLLSRNLRAFRDTVDRVSQVTQLRAGKLVFRPERLDLAALVHEVCKQHAEEAKAARVELRLNTTTTCGEWDRARLQQIVSHLIENAIRYGGGDVDVIVRETSHDAEIVVHDSGPGIPKEAREHLFDGFERKRSGRSSLGVGLWVVKHLCRAMGGSVRLLDCERGARFSVVLPRV